MLGGGGVVGGGPALFIGMYHEYVEFARWPPVSSPSGGGEREARVKSSAGLWRGFCPTRPPLVGMVCVASVLAVYSYGCFV